MGFIRNLFRKTYPKVPSIMPSGAIDDILNGHLPQISSSRIFLNGTEQCCYIDKAILLESKTEHIYRRSGTSMPGLFKGTRAYWGTTKPYEYNKSVQHQAILYITTKRVVLQCEKLSFDKPVRDISTIIPYSNAVELQFGNKFYRLLVPDGNIVNKVINMIH